MSIIKDILKKVEYCEACGDFFYKENKETLCENCGKEMEEMLDSLELIRISEERGWEWILNTLIKKGRGSNWTN